LNKLTYVNNRQDYLLYSLKAYQSFNIILMCIINGVGIYVYVISFIKKLFVNKR